MRQGKQVLFRPAKQRGPQRCCKRQAVLWRRKERQKRAQIPHSRFSADLQTICTGNRKIQFLARANDIRKNSAPALYQDQNVTGLDGSCTILVRNGRFSVQHALDVFRDRQCKCTVLMLRASAIHRVEPLTLWCLFRFGHQWPQVDPARQIGIERDMLAAREPG